MPTILLKDSSTEHSLEFILEVAVPLLGASSAVLGPVNSWSGFARLAWTGMLHLIDELKGEFDPDGIIELHDESDSVSRPSHRGRRGETEIVIRSRQGDEISVPSHIFYDDDAYDRVERLVKTLVSSVDRVELQGLEIPSDDQIA